MKLIGEEVRHDIYGNGLIIEHEISYISVSFSENTIVRRFQYPNAFENHLESLSQKVDKILISAKKKHENQCKKIELEKSKMRTIKENELKELKMIEEKYIHKQKSKRHNEEFK